MTTTLTTTAPAAYAALLGFIQTLTAAEDPPITVIPGDVLQYEPGQYIAVSSVYGHQFDVEATGYFFIETYHLTGVCTVFVGDDEVNVPGTVAFVMASAYGLFTNIVAEAVTTNRGGAGIPVLGIEGPPTPYEILFDHATYEHGPGLLGGGQGGWGGTVSWSFQVKAYLGPTGG